MSSLLHLCRYAFYESRRYRHHLHHPVVVTMALVAGSGFKAVAGGQAAVSWVGARGGFRSGDEVFRGFDSGSGCGLMVLLRYWLDLLQVSTMSLRLRPRHRLRLQQPPSVSSAAPTTKTRKICVFFFRSEHFFPDLTKRRPPSTRWRWWWSHILSDGVVGKATAVVVRHGDGGHRGLRWL